MIESKSFAFLSSAIVVATDICSMKTDRIKQGNTYMIVYRGHEIFVTVDLIVDNHLLCTRKDTNAGIAITSDAVRAGPFNELKKNNR